jgi:hypothetical protein
LELIAAGCGNKRGNTKKHLAQSLKDDESLKSSVADYPPALPGVRRRYAPKMERRERPTPGSGALEEALLA